MRKSHNALVAWAIDGNGRKSEPLEAGFTYHRGMEANTPSISFFHKHAETYQVGKIKMRFEVQSASELREASAGRLTTRDTHTPIHIPTRA